MPPLAPARSPLPHPVKGHLINAGYNFGDVAQYLDIDRSTFSRVLNRLEHTPSQEFAETLSALVCRSIGECFFPENRPPTQTALAAAVEYAPHAPRAPRVPHVPVPAAEIIAAYARLRSKAAAREATGCSWREVERAITPEVRAQQLLVSA